MYTYPISVMIFQATSFRDESSVRLITSHSPKLHVRNVTLVLFQQPILRIFCTKDFRIAARNVFCEARLIFCKILSLYTTKIFTAYRIVNV
jgi:hypothetical protein